MATTNYNINYEDERFKDVESDKQVALDNINNTYNNMINQSDKFYQDQMNAVEDYKNTQQQIQQENTDFTIQQIEQQKEQANKDYTKEQKASYVDWQKQSNQYGANAEQMAASGLTNTGFSESSQASMYNQYQGRVATARESYNQAVLNYNNSIKEAQLSNNAKLAEIAFNALQTQLQLSLEGFQYKNSLLSEQIQQQQATEDRYYSRWQDVLGQMNQENQFAESIRQYEQNYKLQQQQFEEEKRQYEQNYALQIKQFDEGIRQFNEEMARLKEKDAKEYAMEIKQLELQKQQLEEQKRQANLDYQVKQQQLAEQKRQFNTTYEQEYKYTGGSTTQIKTKYYSGPIAKNVGNYGYMGSDNNGVAYQPKGVEINGKAYKLSSTGKTAGQLYGSNATNSSGVSIKNQKVWEAGGNYYIWNGSINSYEQVPKVNNGKLGSTYEQFKAFASGGGGSR